MNVTTGCDPSSRKLAFVELQKNNKPIVFTEDISSPKLEVRSSRAFDVLVDYCIEAKCRLGEVPKIFVEAPVQGRGGPGPTIAQALVTGAVLAGAVQGGAEVSLVNNTTWKKSVTGNGTANKLYLSEWVEKNWNELYKAAPTAIDSSQPKEIRGRADQDVLDAGCIALFGKKYTELVSQVMKNKR